jgi:MATE family multidrug resistance protein
MNGLGQHSDVAKNAQLYVMAYGPALIMNALIDNQRKFLNMVGKSYVPMVCQVTGTIVHPFLCYYFVMVKDMNVRGVGIASSITNSFIFVFLLAYTYRIEEIRPALTIPDTRIFKGLVAYFKIGFASALMVCLEWWAFEVMTLLVGIFGMLEQAANVVVFQIVAFLFMIAMGLSQAAGATIGQQIGANNIPKAKEYYRASMAVSGTVIGVIMVIYFCFNRTWFSIFTNSQDVINAAMSVKYLIFFELLPDMWKVYMQGPIRALGLQSKMVPYNLVGYWILNIMVACVLVFVLKIGYSGFWISLLIAQVFITF